MQIPGLSVDPAEQSVEREKQLLSWLESNSDISWEISSEGRRVAQFGIGRYNYSTQSVDSFLNSAFPLDLIWIFPGCGEEFTQCIINDYDSKDFIPFHTDELSFGPTIRVFCFGEKRPLLLRKVQCVSAEKEEVFSLEIRGGYTLEGDARYQWEHSVNPGESRRISVTFRTLSPRILDENEIPIVHEKVSKDLSEILPVTSPELKTTENEDEEGRLVAIL